MNKLQIARWALGCGMLLALPQAQAQDKIQIGLSAPLTGDFAEYGNNFKSGALLAVKQVNQAGGLHGKQIELVTLDSRGDPKEGVIIAQKFVSNPKILAVAGDFSSAVSIAAAPLYNAGKLVNMSPTAVHPDYTRTGPFIFRGGATAKSEGGFDGRWTAKDLGFKRIALIYLNDDAYNAYAKAFTEIAIANGGTIVASEKYAAGEKDFTASLTKIKAANPDVLYVGTRWSDGAGITVQTRKLGLSAPLVSMGAVVNQEFLKATGPAAEGLRASTAFFAADPRPAARRFVSAFQAEYNAIPLDFAALAYDTTSMLLDAIRRGGEDRDKVRAALTATKDFDGATGVFNFDAERTPTKDFTKLQVVDGKWAIAKN